MSDNFKKALSNYFNVLDGKKEPKFKIAKDNSLLNKKIKEAYKILENCELCERACRVNRLEQEKGHCEVSDKINISSIFAHYGEEPFFIPSLTIFFISCTFECQFCQNWTISQRKESGVLLGEKELAEVIDKAIGCKNINFVGGEPTPHLPFILKTLSYVKANLPVVWNSNFYMSEKSMELLKGIVDVYLSDFKYGNDKCAERLSKIKNYTEIVERNHLLAFEDSELVIRHLVLPNHIECCTKPILEWISDNLGDKVIVNIMSQYLPQYLAEKYKDINRRLTIAEFSEAVNYAKKLKLNFIT